MTLSRVSSALYTSYLLQHSLFKGQVAFFLQLHNIGGIAGVGFSHRAICGCGMKYRKISRECNCSLLLHYFCWRVCGKGYAWKNACLTDEKILCLCSFWWLHCMRDETKLYFIFCFLIWVSWALNIAVWCCIYSNFSNRFNLCLEEKIAILQANPADTLNQRTKLVLKCRHKAKYKLRNHQPN